MLLAKTVADNTASFDWALPPGFARFRIEGEGYQPVSDLQDMALLVSTDGGSNYATSGYLNSGLWFLSSDHGVIGSVTTKLLLCAMGQAYDVNTQSLVATLYGAQAGRYLRLMGQAGGTNGNGTFTGAFGIGEYNASTDRVTHVRLLTTSGNIKTGTFRLYGEP